MLENQAPRSPESAGEAVVQQRSRWNASRTVVVLLAACPLALFGGPAADALAAPVIEVPTPGATTNATPTFGGSTTNMLEPVEVQVYRGPSIGEGETPVETASAGLPAPEGSWTVTPGQALTDGVYTAVAEQDELGQPSESEPVTFTVDTNPPTVTLDQPPTPSSDTSPTLAGSASEAGEVVVRVYEGTKAEGSEVAKVATTTGGGSWSVGVSLPGGDHTYTAVAKEASGLGNGEGESEARTFVVDTDAPVVTLNQPASPSSDTTPTLAGSASEPGEVVVRVYEGAKAEGSEVAKVATTTGGGSWSVGVSLPGGDHTYTAVASEASGLGNGEGESQARTFVVDTDPPTVTLDQPVSPSDDTTPTLSGKASEAGEVVVRVYEGARAEGSEVAKASTTASAGNWSIGVSLPGGDHTYTAVAREASGLGNGEGESQARTFVVDTNPPTVTLDQPPTPSNDTTPTLGGKASEDTTVVVRVYEGSKAEGKEVAKASTTASGGSWSAGVSLPTGDHTYTAVAKEASGVGNGEGESEARTFVVDTNAPVVTLNQPASPSSDTTPTLAGSASEAGEVVVRVYEGAKAEGKEVAKVATTTGGGSWSVGVSLPGGDHTYTAVAKEASGLGNGEGESQARTFVVDTDAPVVTLNQPASPSNDTTPTLSGKASEAGEVVVRVYEGTKAEGSEVAKASTTASGGNWSAGVSLPGGDHTYTAVAKEASGLGNGEGESEARTFVVDTNAPTVTLNQPASPSNDTSPTLAGSASEAGEVVVRVYEGTKAEGKEVAKASTTASGGTWSAGVSLSSGNHTYTAVAKEASGLGNGEGESQARTFVVDTNAPTVTLNQPVSPSNDTSPTLAGSASEAGEVVVRVYEGSKAEGKEVAKASTTTSGGTWSAGVSLPGGDHTYTAVAKEASGLGNGEGESQARTFVVDTNAPTVTLNQPVSPSNDATPSLSGQASENTTVVVRVYEGTKAEGSEVAKASTTASGGSWSAGVSLPGGDHTYTAVAKEASGLGNGEGESEARTFVVDTNAPTVTLNQPVSPSNDTTPTLAGSASEAGEVVVRVYEGTKAEGKEVTKASATVNGGNWSAGVSLPTGDHTYTALAKEASGLGNSPGESQARTFVVDTNPPTVTLNQPATPSNDTTPALAGSASEGGEVVVRVYEGSKAEGKEVAKASTTASGGSWSAGVSLASGDHTYTAVAAEASGLGNGEGKSEARTFVVDTNPPTVTLNAPASLSNDATPSFSGKASENTAVVVRVYEGTKAEGSEVAKASTTATGGSWSVGVSLPGGDHMYTAVAKEASGLGNGEGESEARTFVVDTNPPTVTLNAPASPSKNTTPSFGGSASENTQVVVHVYEGSKAEGKEVAKASTTASGGSWSVGVSLPGGDHMYTAVAKEASGLGNGEGESEARTFVVDTNPPTVTLNAPASPSKNTTPSFGGSASENTQVVVHVYEGSKAEGKEVAKASVTASAGTWSSGAVSPALATGEHTYTAVATEASGLGNGEGKSEARTFVVDTNPPTVTLNQPASPSNDTTPTFAGKASENTEVVVHVYEGTKAEGSEVAKAAATGKEGAWTSPTVSLASGDHTYTAIATEVSGLGNAAGKSEARTFVIDTLAPKVTLNKPKLESAETQPQFTGTASEAGTVTVEVFKGPRASGERVAMQKAVLSTPGGEWETAHIPALGNGEYTAIASEPSTISGNPTGSSEPATFVVNTQAPNVVLDEVAPSNDRSPSFEGKASGKNPVTVDVYEGPKPEGRIVASVTASVGAGGTWKSSAIAEPLAEGDHVYTAVAEEKGQETGTGRSRPVEVVVDTLAPTVTLEAPPSPSNNQAPSFSGTTSEPGDVTVRVYEGSKEVAKATAVAGDETWSSGAVSPPLGDGEYTAVAEQPSRFAGNGTGVSKAVSFVIDTRAPTVTLHEVQSPSADTEPSFSGAASDHTPVTVEVFRGGSPTGTPVATLTADVIDGVWSTPKLEAQLAWGEYTAVATQPSSIEGNEAGASAPDTFVVEQLAPSATTEAGAAVSESSAYLHGYVDPNKGNVEACYFEWGTTTSYGGEAECALSSGEETFPSGANAAIPVFARIFGLKAGTTYHFRLHVVNEGGAASVGADQAVTTLAAPFQSGPPKSSSEGHATSASQGAGGVLSSIAEQILAPGKGVTIKSVLKRGYYPVRFKAPEPGTVTIGWYYTPPSAKHAVKGKKSKPQPVLVASAKLTFKTASTATLEIRLTRSGKRLLAGLERVTLGETCSFAPSGQAPVKTTTTFQLKR